MLPGILKMIGRNRRALVITASKNCLSKDFFRAAGVDDSMPVIVAGLDDSRAFNAVYMAAPIWSSTWTDCAMMWSLRRRWWFETIRTSAQSCWSARVSRRMRRTCRKQPGYRYSITSGISTCCIDPWYKDPTKEFYKSFRSRPAAPAPDLPKPGFGHPEQVQMSQEGTQWTRPDYLVTSTSTNRAAR